MGNLETNFNAGHSDLNHDKVLDHKDTDNIYTLQSVRYGERINDINKID